MDIKDHEKPEGTEVPLNVVETFNELEDLPAFAFPSKKRKKLVVCSESVVVTEAVTPDYTYMELLDRVYSALRKNNPNYDAPQPRLQVPFPQLALYGSKRIMWMNFAKTCDILHRTVDHVQSFVLAELSTIGSIDVNGRLILRGRLTKTHIETILKKYIDEYVMCRVCKQNDTILAKDPVSRFLFLECQLCQSKRTVLPIRAGFHVQTGADRKKLREEL
jgi:translation initiation factor 2 subunit 2